jgi:hypothetical protein
VDEAAVDGFGTETAQEGDRCLVGGPELVVGGHAAGLEVVAVDLLGFSPPAERGAQRGTIDGSSGSADHACLLYIAAGLCVPSIYPSVF